MKWLILNYFLIAILSTSAVFTSCSTCGCVDKQYSECDILLFVDGTYQWEIDGLNITGIYNEGTDLSNLTPDITVSFCAIYSPIGAQDFSNSKDVIYTVTAEDGSTKTYTASAMIIDGKDKARLLETMTHSNGFCHKYEYDTQNRISKIMMENNGKLIGMETFSYSENDLINVVYENPERIEYGYTTNFVKSGSRITATIKYISEINDQIKIIDLNTDDFPIEVKYSNELGSQVAIYQYQEFNLTKITTISKDYREWVSITTYEYDNKKSPFYNCKTPKWYNYFANDGIMSGQNNVTNVVQEQEYADDITISFEYTYDDEGFPIKANMTKEDKGCACVGEGAIEIAFKYK